jgi:hypothetical protein
MSVVAILEQALNEELNMLRQNENRLARLRQERSELLLMCKNNRERMSEFSAALRKLGASPAMPLPRR